MILLISVLTENIGKNWQAGRGEELKQQKSPPKKEGSWMFI